jgi:hypothetical protein
VLGTCKAIGELDVVAAPQLRRNLRAAIDLADTLFAAVAQLESMAT